VVEGDRARHRTTETNIRGINGIEVLSELAEKAAIISPYPQNLTDDDQLPLAWSLLHYIVAAAFALGSAAVAVALARQRAVWTARIPSRCILEALARERGETVVALTHDLNMAARMDRR
jgi:hypothetical protein